MPRASLTGVTPDATPSPPAIADYELIRLVGRGSYGDVWLARGVTGLYRAVKLVWRDRFEDAQPFEREFRGLKEFAAVSLLEARQLALLHVGRNDAAGFFYYVMELADDVDTGREIDPARYVPHTLKEVRTRRGRLPATEVVALAVEITRGLAGLHSRGLVHRDIKPSNVIVVGGAPKLADIGLVASASAALTFVGTEGYVPPEGPGAPAADVFSLGKLLYELATGLDRHDYPRLPPELHTLPDRKELLELNEVTIRACEPDARQRHQDATALLDDLLLLQAGRSVRKLRNAERRLSRALRVAAGLAVATTVAAGGGWLEHQRAATETALRREAEAERDDLARKTVYSAGLARAQRALETNSLGLARKFLRELAPASGQPDLCGIEWHSLWRESEGDPAEVLRQNGPPVQRVFFSPDGKLIAAQSLNRAMTIWDAVTHREIRRIPGVFRLAGFSGDSRWLVGVNLQAAFQRWSVATGIPEESSSTGINRPLAAVGNDQGISFVDGSTNMPHAVRLWDFARQSEVARLNLAFPPETHWDFYRAAVSGDRGLVALALIEGRSHEARWNLQIFDLRTKRLLFEETTPHRISALAFAPDAKRLACALGDTAEIAVLEIEQRRWSWRLSFGADQANALEFSPDGSHLAFGGRGRTVQVADAATGSIESEWHGHEASIEDIAWSPDGVGFASGGSAGDLRLWSLSSPLSTNEIRQLWRPAGGGRRLCLSDDGMKLSASDDPERGALVAISTTGATLGRIPGAFMPIIFSSDGTALSGTRSDGEWQVWRVGPNPQLISSQPLFATKVRMSSAVAISRDRRVIAAGDNTGQLVFCDASSRQVRSTTKAHKGAVQFVALTPEGSLAISGGEDLRTYLWETKNGQRKGQLVPRAVITQAAFSADGRWLALALQSGEIEIRFAPSWGFARRLRTGSSLVLSVAFSADGTRLAAGGSEGAVHLFDLRDWREVTTLLARAPREDGDASVAEVSFSQDGTALSAYLNNGRVRTWRSQGSFSSPE